MISQFSSLVNRKYFFFYVFSLFCRLCPFLPTKTPALTAPAVLHSITLHTASFNHTTPPTVSTPETLTCFRYGRIRRRHTNEYSRNGEDSSRIKNNRKSKIQLINHSRAPDALTLLLPISARNNYGVVNICARLSGADDEIAHKEQSPFS